MHIQLALDPVYTVHSRTVLNLFDVLSSVGGLYQSVYLIGFGFTISFSYNLMLTSLIRQLYHFKPRFASERKQK